jgi:signal transduction histidine kinase
MRRFLVHNDQPFRHRCHRMQQSWTRARIGFTILAASLLMLAHSAAAAWLADGSLRQVGPRSMLALCHYASAGALVWLASARFDPWLLPRLPAFGPRLLLGELGLLAAITLLTALVYGALFPLLFGRFPTAAGTYAVAYKTTVVAMLVYGWLLFNRGSQGAQSAALALQTDANRLAAGVERAELAMLQAQVEPHFLFNTLALVKRQYRVDPANAALVLDTLVSFLESAAPALRRDDWTVGQELDLVQLYLDILAHRFGSALTHHIDVAPNCRPLRMPALVLATLVENAVRHGLAPKAGSGHVAITAELAAQGLSIAVVDDGVGLRQQSGSGMGLTTVRARLRAAFGDAANLLVQPRPSGGVSAILTVAGAL